MRLNRLDGLRGIAILLVVVWHYGGRTEGSFANLVKPFTSLAWSGVDLFFVLSGFLIGGQLLANKGADGYFTTFYARRVVRILPLYSCS